MSIRTQADRSTPFRFKHKLQVIATVFALDAENCYSSRDISQLLLRRGVKISNVTVRKWLNSTEMMLAVRLYQGKLLTMDSLLTLNGTPIPCYSCIFNEELKARTCDPRFCTTLDEYLCIAVNSP